ncbi:hypothetical protein GC101_17205 [Paenibacillus sp. LMG 31459]|uniref:Uncharacterized protein n=1 Tax=Paenibacillus phytohabitans TaxID=2654978 RepID=A0ABX1YJQ7_9BACL|nr:hypothetical protein [Paenibacillus phytohabitans]NOU80604.1 hypothetical protein [Paenibacillus phytohabitans]
MTINQGETVTGSCRRLVAPGELSIAAPAAARYWGLPASRRAPAAAAVDLRMAVWPTGAHRPPEERLPLRLRIRAQPVTNY